MQCHSGGKDGRRLRNVVRVGSDFRASSMVVKRINKMKRTKKGEIKWCENVTVCQKCGQS